MILLEKSQCVGCGACTQVCPKNCIEMMEDNEGFVYPKFDETQCIECGLCTKVCVAQSPKNVVSPLQKAYAVKNKNSSIRKKSSSGGVFAALGKTIISEKGLVFGAKFTSTVMVEHSKAEQDEEIKDLMGSKYTQSYAWKCFKEIKNALQNEKKVLFVGTPCQVAALNNYLPENYSNLITVEIACHGVPSRKLLVKYIDWLEQQKKAEIKHIDFRNKKNGWMNYSVQISYDNGKTFNKSHFKDSFMRMFLNEYFLRPSCYLCQFKGIDRHADITISDFWNIRDYASELDDDQGVSLVYLNTDKGNNLFDCIVEQIECKKIDITEALYKNSALIERAKCPPDRNQYTQNMDDFKFKELEKKTTIPYWREEYRRFKYKVLKGRNNE